MDSIRVCLNDLTCRVVAFVLLFGLLSLVPLAADRNLRQMRFSSRGLIQGIGAVLLVIGLPLLLIGVSTHFHSGSPKKAWLMNEDVPESGVRFWLPVAGSH